MSGEIRLALRVALDRRLDVSCVAPDRLAQLGVKEIERLEIWPDAGGPRALGEFFSVTGERSLTVRVQGNLELVDGLGTAMSEGELIAEGDAGHAVGSSMTGGRLTVHGSAGRDAGLAMRGGVLLVQGSVGSNCGGSSPGASRGMTGGEIIIMGSAGPEAGARMRRGLLFVAGDAGPYAGRTMIAGTVIVGGRTARGAGQWSKRGSIVALGGVEPPASYRLAAIYRPLWVSLFLTSLRARYRIPVTDAHVNGRYRRYSGDLAELGKGEILEWTAG